HVFKAPNYDEIVDAPVEMGHLTIRNFTVGDATYALVIDRRDPKFPLQSTEDLLRRIIRHQVGMFGGAPFTHYEVHLHEGVGWGLEHLTSQTDAVPMRLIRDNGPGVFDSLFAHEFFHLWNVKRLRPKALGPFDYQAPCRTKHLWFSEGVTDYYADLTCRRTGLWNDRKWWESWGGEVNRLQGTRIRFDEPITTTSWLAFDRGYAAQIFGRGLDYYNKGKILGLLLDLVIREETGGARSLDDVMRALYAKYAYPKPGFDDDALVGEMSAAAGVDLKEFFRRYVEGTSELPYADVLAFVGVETRGVREPNPALAERLATAEGLEVVDGRFVFRDASVFGESEGLKDGDVLTKVEGVEAHTSEGRALGDLFAAVGGDHVYEIVVKRGVAEVPLTITLPLAGRRTFRRDAKASDDAKAAYDAWLADPYTEKVPPGETKDTLGLE
ncbi:MAG TPA: hypothetical protein VEI02_09135, partial [Planctomycetota bacterium]|nr:hypothetical protein [Planctomycetota bacterium]